MKAYEIKAEYGISYADCFPQQRQSDMRLRSLAEIQNSKRSDPLSLLNGCEFQVSLIRDK